MTDRISRRALLRGAGGVAIGLPLLESLTADRGAAAAVRVTPPKRLITFFTPNGSTPPALPGLGANQQHLVVLDGIVNVAATSGPGDDHMRGMGSMLTGVELLPGTTLGSDGDPAGLGGGISVDQAIANQIGGRTRFKSLQLGINATGAGTPWGYTSYAGAGQPLPPDNIPASVFNRLFSTPRGDGAELRRIRAEGRSILDGVAPSATRLNARLGAWAKAQLDEHLARIRDLETRITSPAGAIDCKSDDSVPLVGKLQTELLVMALACDLTRVATLQWQRAAGDVRFRWVDPAITRGHHDLSHDADSNRDSVEQLAQIDAWFARQFNDLIESLKAVPDGNGGTLLDSTLVVWCSELAKGNRHAHDDLRFVLAGHAGGALQGGRSRRFDGVSHNDLLVTLMNLMGVPATTFGNRALCSGPLAGV